MVSFNERMALVGAFVGGAVSSYFLRQSTPNSLSGITILGWRGLQGTAGLVAAIGVSSISSVVASSYIKNGENKNKRNDRENFVIIIAYLATGGVITVAAKHFRSLGTPTEAAVNFALSAIGGYIGYRINW